MKMYADKRQGFSLVELVIAVAMMAILVGVSVPSVFQFIKMRDKQQEEVYQQEIKGAIQAYLAEKNILPSDTTGNWASELAGYSKLSAPMIANDAWGNPRSYIRAEVVRPLNGISVTINYATVLSMGPDAQASPSAGVATTTSGTTIFAGYSAGGANGWWRNRADIGVDAAFAATKVAAGSDDIMLKFNDYSSKLENFSSTMQRLNKTTDALESYARANYSRLVTYCNGTTKDENGVSTVVMCQNGAPEQIIYTPYGKPNGSVADVALYFNPDVDVSDTAHAVVPASTLTPVVDNTQGDVARRTGMVRLMRTLGLPDEYCCSAYENSLADGKPKPFYYFSNPRRIVSNACATTRPGPTDSKLPARITSVTPNGVDSCD